MRAPYPENAIYTLPRINRERLSVGASPNPYFRGHSIEFMTRSDKKKENASLEDEIHKFPLTNRIRSSIKKANQTNNIKQIIPIAE